MSHKCSNLVLHCIDFRFMRGIREYLDACGFTGDSDIVSMAGAAKNLLESADPSSAATARLQIKLSHDLHGISRVILMNHLDCGAYGGRAAFASDEEEYSRHAEDLRSARASIVSEYPSTEVRLIIAKIDADGNVSFEEIDDRTS